MREESAGQIDEHKADKQRNVSDGADKNERVYLWRLECSVISFASLILWIPQRAQSSFGVSASCLNCSRIDAQ